MSYECKDCEVRWWAYQTEQGACPRCGGGTVLSRKAPSRDSVALYQEARKEWARGVLEEEAEKARALKREAFEAYLAKRDSAEIAVLEGWLALPCAPDGPGLWSPWEPA